MRSYECLYIINPAADQTELNSSTEKYGELITGKGGTLGKADIWGKRKLAYPIGDFSDGNYILLRFEAEPETIAELEFRMRVDDRIMRYMTSYEIPEGAGRSEELMQLTERKDRDRRGRGRGRGGRYGDRDRSREPRGYRESRGPSEARDAKPVTAATAEKTPEAPVKADAAKDGSSEGGSE